MAQEWYILQTRAKAEHQVGLAVMGILGVQSTTINTENAPHLLKVKLLHPISRDLREKLEGVVSRVEVPSQQVKQGVKVVQKGIYPRYVFVQMNHHPGTAGSITRALGGLPGVLEMAGGWRTPQPMSEEEASVLMKQVGEAQEAETIEFSEGDTVRVLEGAFQEKVGRILAINASRRMVRVSIPIFGKETPVEVEVDKVVSI